MQGSLINERLLIVSAALIFALMAGNVQAKETFDPKLCQALTKHVPAPDVAYQPGVDVHGNAVMPADLPADDNGMPKDHFEIPLSYSLAKALGVSAGSYPLNALGTGSDVKLGTLVVDGNDVTLNGKPLSGAQKDNLAVLCMEK